MVIAGRGEALLDLHPEQRHSEVLLDLLLE
jgi:hypothetical protein